MSAGYNSNYTYLLETLPSFCFCPVTLKVLTKPVTVDAPCRCNVSSEAFHRWIVEMNKDSCPGCGTKCISRGKTINYKLRASIRRTVKIVRLGATQAPKPKFSMPHKIKQVTDMTFIHDINRKGSFRGKYTGEIDENTGLPHGEGCMIYNDHDIYKGHWENGSISGCGVVTLAVGDEYDGEWKNNTKHGYGVERFPNGQTYEGEWRNNKKHGQGVVTSSDGVTQYEGEFQNGNKNGRGIFTSRNGETYEGMFRDGVAHGHGIYTSVNGDKYEGEWKDNFRHGKGFCLYINGDVYEGEWVNNKKHGRGIYKSSNGNRYEGEYQNDKKNGHGVDIYAKGGRYEGQWVDDKRRGPGVSVSAHGSRRERLYTKGIRPRDFVREKIHRFFDVKPMPWLGKV
eukprot:scaffold102133_cov61-Attheya_sp.AAC.3